MTQNISAASATFCISAQNNIYRWFNSSPVSAFWYTQYCMLVDCLNAKMQAPVMMWWGERNISNTEKPSVLCSCDHRVLIKRNCREVGWSSGIGFAARKKGKWFSGSREDRGRKWKECSKGECFGAVGEAGAIWRLPTQCFERPSAQVHSLLIPSNV